MNRKAFTLVEIMIIVAIMAILVTIVIPNATNIIEDAKENICREKTKTADNTKVRWAVDNNEEEDAEPTAEDLAEYVTNGDAVTTCVIAGALFKVGNITTPTSCTYHGNSLGQRPPHYREEGCVFSSLYDEWIPIGKTYTAGDANKDGIVNVLDLSILAGNYGNSGSMTWDDGDFNDDEHVSISDLGALGSNWLQNE